MSGKGGDLNGSTQHLARTRLALKTKAKIACSGLTGRNAALARFWPSAAKQMVLPRKHCRINALGCCADPLNSQPLPYISNNVGPVKHFLSRLIHSLKGVFLPIPGRSLLPALTTSSRSQSSGRL